MSNSDMLDEPVETGRISFNLFTLGFGIAGVLLVLELLSHGGLRKDASATLNSGGMILASAYTLLLIMQGTHRAAPKSIVYHSDLGFGTILVTIVTLYTVGTIWYTETPLVGIGDLIAYGIIAFVYVYLRRRGV